MSLETRTRCGDHKIRVYGRPVCPVTLRGEARRSEVVCVSVGPLRSPGRPLPLPDRPESGRGPTGVGSIVTRSFTLRPNFGWMVDEQ